MLNLNNIIALINDQGYAQDIGQIGKDTKRELLKLVRAGVLRKSREPLWMMMAVEKTTYRAG